VSSAHKRLALTWAAPPNNGSALTVYEVYRSTVSGAASMLATVSAATPSYNDGNVIRGVVYYYSVAACNAFGCGPTSAQVSGAAH
jgi:hypothetical protein